MTMSHIERSFKVSLSVMHPDIDPSEISAALELTPRRATRAGAPRTTPKGDPLPGASKCSCWTHEFGVEGASELGVVLESLVARLQRNRQFRPRHPLKAFARRIASSAGGGRWP